MVKIKTSIKVTMGKVEIRALRKFLGTQSDESYEKSQLRDVEVKALRDLHELLTSCDGR